MTTKIKNSASVLLLLLLFVSAWSLPVKAQTDKIPTDAELQILLQKTIQSLADALESGDFAAFQSDTATDSVLHGVSPQRLKEIYGNQKDNVEAMRLTVGSKANFSQMPSLTEYTARTRGSSDVRTYSSLNLIGSYDQQSAGSGQMFKFNIQYLGEKGEWKLLIFNELQITTDLSKPMKAAGNLPPFTYRVPDNSVDLLNSVISDSIK